MMNDKGGDYVAAVTVGGCWLFAIACVVCYTLVKLKGAAP